VATLIRISTDGVRVSTGGGGSVQGAGRARSDSHKKVIPAKTFCLVFHTHFLYVGGRMGWVSGGRGQGGNIGFEFARVGDKEDKGGVYV
jgi:hypothetical protein